jgi:hypothetical protein
VPRELKDREKINQMDLSLQHLLRYAAEEDMLNKIVTVDESWVHHYQTESNCASMQWKRPSSPSTKKVKVMPAVGKVMLTVFWDSEGVLLAHFQKHRTVKFCRSFGMQFAENVEANWQDGHCSS